MSESKVSTWTKTNLFNPASIKESVTISRWERLRLLFRRNWYSYDVSDDGAALTRYKRMDGMIYVLEVKFTAPKESV